MLQAAFINSPSRSKKTNFAFRISFTPEKFARTLACCAAATATRGDLEGVKRRLAKRLMAIAGVYKVLKWSKLVTDGAKVVLKIWCLWLFVR